MDESDDPPAGMPFMVQPPEDPHIDIKDANISDAWGSDYQTMVREVLEKHTPLFRPELGMFNDGIEMPIPFKQDADLSKLKQAPYNLSFKDQSAIDAYFDPLAKQGKVKRVPLGQPSAAASPAFVIWKNNKPRVVVDLRRVNSAVYPDAYPLPKQDTILQALGGGVVFSSLDIVKSFFQQAIREEDQWKTAFVTPHRGHEMLCVATMGLINSPGFFQHRMELLLSEYLWKFVLVYIDDVIIFSRTLDEHLKQLHEVLQILEQAGITLSLAKCHFAYPSIQALGHEVSRLGLSTAQDKVDAIYKMLFPDSLKQLEYVIGFFGYYRKFVEGFAWVAAPLVILKTKGFKRLEPTPEEKGSKHKRERFAISTEVTSYATPEELKAATLAFEALKDKLCNAPVLAYPDFKRGGFIIYVDGSKERGFGVSVHQPDENGKERPILFLSRLLTDAETRYFPTELETGALVWALQKLPHYTDHGKFTVYCDHQAVRQSFEDAGPLKGKRSERLMGWRIFLAKFAGRMEIIHIPGKEHRNADGLSRIKNADDPPASQADSQPSSKVVRLVRKILPAKRQYVFITTRRQAAAQAQASAPPPPPSSPLLPPIPEDSAAIKSDDPPATREPTPEAETSTPEEQTPVPSLDTELSEDDMWKADHLQITEQRRKDLIRGLETDKAFSTIYKDICKRIQDTDADEDGPVTTKEAFHVDIDSKLLYHIEANGHKRLCIPQKFHREMLQVLHDRRTHQGMHRVLNRLRTNFFIPKARKVVGDYIRTCPTCAVAKPTHHPPFGELQTIKSPGAPFVIQTLDFIVSLPASRNGYDALLTVTDKFTKHITLIPGKTTWTAHQWAIAYFDYVFAKYGFPATLISDRDPKFTSEFWTSLFRRAGVTLAMTAAYHPSANGQSERTNQTVETALRCLIADHTNARPVSEWDELLPDVEYALNTSESATTGLSPFLLLYGVEPRSEFDPSNSQPSDFAPAEDFLQDRRQIRRDAADSIKLAQARMEVWFNRKHTPVRDADMVWLKLAKGTNVGYRLPNMSSIDVNKIGPFKVKRRIGSVAFELELPVHLKIHPVISCIHLEPALEDPLDRTAPPLPPLTIDGEERYIIDRIVRKERRRERGDRELKIYYKIRWQGYSPHEDSWIEEEELRSQVPELVDTYNSSLPRRRRQ